jgi:ferredoxin-NADP reductase/MOSC domain-containing protein YiiM/ferredoxin
VSETINTPETGSASPIAGTLLSVNVGLPRDVPWNGTVVHTGIYKQPMAGPRSVRRLNVDGDGQGDLAGHGGEQRAVMVYQQESYEHWSRELGRDDLRPGHFGENFTVAGLADADVCIGDRYRIGDAEFEVTQPRVTCFRVGLRLGVPQMASMLVAHRRPGFYLRVLQEGVVEAGDPVVKLSSGRHGLSVAGIDGLLYLPHRSHELLEKAVDVPALSPGWQQSFRDLLAAADEETSGSAASATSREPGWPGFRPLTVTRIVQETPSVRSFYLADGSGAALPDGRAGQYLTLRVPLGGASAVRSYSLSGRPDEQTYRISVKREEHGTVSGHLHDRVAVGDVIDVAAPRGDFVLDAGDEPVVLLSAGIGVTPVLSMLAFLAKAPARGEVWWLHVARTADDYGLATEADRLLASLPSARSLLWLTRSPRPSDAPPPSTRYGRLDVAALRDLGLPTGASVYICGPAGFNDAMTEAMTTLGFAAERIHVELFGALAPLTPGVAPKKAVTPHPPAGAPGSGPAITFVRSDLTVAWSDRFGSLLEFAEACDVPVRFSCRTGVCHTCVTGIVSGGVDYSPEPLERPEPSEVLLCCSRPTTETVLDA